MKNNLNNERRAIKTIYKNKRDFYIYSASIMKTKDKILKIVTVILLIPTIFTFFHPTGGLTERLLLLLQFCLIVYQIGELCVNRIRNIVHRQSTIVNIPIRYVSKNENVDIDNIEVFIFEKDEIFNQMIQVKVNNTTENVGYSSDINQVLASGNIEYILDKGYNKEVRKHIKENSEQLKVALFIQSAVSNFNFKEFYNQEKLGLHSISILGEGDKKKLRLGVHKTTYFDTFLTNIAPRKKYEKNELVSNGIDLRELFPITRNEINGRTVRIFDDIGRNKLANEFGVSTIGIYNDNHFVLLRQNRNAQSNEGIPVPTGSGSMDFRDYKKYHSVLDPFKKAINRELREENNSSVANSVFTEENVTTQLTGLFRWYEKGGKPEITGLTKIDTPYIGNNIRENVNEEEVQYLSVFKFKDEEEMYQIFENIIDKGVPRICEKNVNENCFTNEIFSLKETLYEQPSVPLYMCLKFALDLRKVGGKY